MDDKEKAISNANNLKIEIEKLDILSSNHKYKEFWQHVKIISELFKTTKPILKDDRESLWSRFNCKCEDAKIKREINDKNSTSNANKIRNEIEALSSGHWNLFKRQYKEFWQHVKIISELFKTTKPLLREDREKLWSKFNYICDDVRRTQNSENENKKGKSENYRDMIMREIRSSEPCSLFGLDPMTVEGMKDLGKVLNNAGAMLSKYKSDMFGEHKQECFNGLEEVRKLHNYWWMDYKKSRSERHESFRSNTNNNLERNRERHRKASDTLDKMRNHADDLRDKIDSAYNDNWRDNAQVWLSELEDKISNTEDYLKKLEEWIEKDEGKLR